MHGMAHRFQAKTVGCNSVPGEFPCLPTIHVVLAFPFNGTGPYHQGRNSALFIDFSLHCGIRDITS